MADEGRRADLEFQTIPKLADHGGGTVRRRGRARRRGCRRAAVVRRAARRRAPWRGCADRRGHRARRPGRDLGAEHVGMGRRRAGRPLRRRCAGAAQHALQGNGGRAHPAREPRPPAVHRDRVPRHGLRRAALPRGRHEGAPRPRSHRAPARRAPRRRGVERSLSAGSGTEASARAAGGRSRRPLRHAVHVGNHRRAQGRDDDARAEPARVRRLGRRRRPARAAIATWS